jgi:uncharacterized protein YukE
VVLAQLPLTGLCTALTQTLTEFLQAHTATLAAYAAHWEGPTGPQFEVAHRTLTQEVEHVERLVGTLQRDLARVLRAL